MCSEPGARLEEGTPYYCVTDANTGQSRVVKYKGKETAIVDEVRVIGTTISSYLLNVIRN